MSAVLLIEMMDKILQLKCHEGATVGDTEPDDC